MPPEPVPADPGWDEDLAWLDRDPMTSAEREAWLDWVCEHEEPPGEEDYGDVEPFTAQELTALLKKRQPRLYSISSSPKAHPDSRKWPRSHAKYCP